MTENTPAPETQVFPVFVYGSLRPGLYNHRMAIPALAHEPFPAVVHGYELYANRSDSYPYLTPGEGDVVGEVLLLEPGIHLDRIIGMEEGAGYETRIVKADITLKDGSIQTINAIGFVHLRRDVWGTKVTSGDWKPYFAEAEKRTGRQWGNW